MMRAHGLRDVLRAGTRRDRRIASRDIVMFGKWNGGKTKPNNENNEKENTAEHQSRAASRSRKYFALMITEVFDGRNVRISHGLSEMEAVIPAAVFICLSVQR